MYLEPGVQSQNKQFILGGPGKHLRRVQLNFDSIFFKKAWKITLWGSRFSIQPLNDLAHVAHRLESLEFNFRRPSTIFGYIGEHQRGPDLALREYSWMDPPLELPDRLTGVVRYPSPGQIDRMAAVVRRLTTNTDAFLESNLERFPEYRDGVWIRVLLIQEQKRFFSRKVLGFLKLLQARNLRTLSIVGTVDKKWMAAVANSTGLTVRARMTGFQADT